MAPNTIIPDPVPGARRAARRVPGPNEERPGAASTSSARPYAFPVVAFAASLLAHALLIAILTNTAFRAQIAAPEDRIISMRLLPRAEIIDAQPPASEDPPPQTPPESEPLPDSDTPAAEETIATARPPTTDTPTTDAPTTDTRTADESREPPDAAPAGRLRATLLEQVRALPAESGEQTRPALPWSSSGEPLPGVPGVRGWISGYIATVTPSAHTWKDNDGASRGRYVLANGTVVCTRRRAPTIDELMNPWKSIAVTMGSICGRQRPDAADFTNPRVQPPPSIVREAPAGRD